MPATAGTFTVNLPAANGDVVVTGGGSTVQFGAGSVSAPSITFSGDTNTGIYSPAPDTIAFTEGGVEAMRIDASGNVGIGTSSPTVKLEVAGALMATGNLSAAGNTINFGGNDATNTILNIGGTPTGNKFAITDYIGDTTYTDFGLRVGRANDGANGTSLIQHRGTGSLVLDAFDAGTVMFKTSSTERARITASGSLLLNTSDDYGRVTVRWDNAGQQGLTLFALGGTFNGSPVVFYNSSAGVSGFIGQTASSVSYNTGSDYRLKENVTPLTGAAARVQALKPSRFNFIADPDRTVDGFLAHEAAKVVPEAVTGEKDAVNEDGSIKPQGIDQSKLVPLLTAALQEALSRIETLEARLAAVEAR